MMKKTHTDEEFFIGWERQVPALQRRFLYDRLFGIFAFVFSLAILIPFMQRRYEPSFYKSMTKNYLEGVFVADPIPSLFVARPGTIRDELLENSHYLLVNPGKFGFPEDVAKELDGKGVRLKGSLVYDRNQTMFEVDHKHIEILSSGLPEIDESQPLELLGKYKLIGEIVDSKSFYGAINPGFGKPNRATAVRSIANGVPPLLLIRSENGELKNLIVLGKEGEVIGPLILDRIAIPVRVTGNVYRWGGKFVIHTEPAFIEVLDD